MGLYNVNCTTCNRTHQWFSGTTDQRCYECKNFHYKETKMVNPTLEEQLIDTLKSTIAAKDDLIDHLKREIQRLSASPIYIPPSPITPNTGTPQFPNPPNLQPFIQPLSPFLNPPIGPPYPGQPWWGIIPPEGWQTVSGTPNTTITGTVISDATSCAHEMVKYGDERSGGESCKKCGQGSGWVTSTSINNGINSTVSHVWPEAPESIKPKKKK